MEGVALWTCFAGAFLAVAVWESLRPKRDLSEKPERRWRNHGALLAIAVIGSALVLRVTPVLLAAAVADNRFGVLNKPWAPLVVRCVIAIALLDMLQYWIHWSFHHFALLWRIHQVHHSDHDYDVSTAGRFHPLEVLFTQGVRFGAIALVAPPVSAVLISELFATILNLSAHANASLPPWAEKTLRFVLVTPDLHRIHHSREMAEQQRNLGQTFPWWDRLFGTYVARAAAEGALFRTGLDGMESCDSLRLGFMLAEPFRWKQRQEPEVSPDPVPD